MDGKINDKFEKQRSKKITDALEKRFGLIPSSKVADKAVEETPKIDTNKGNIKELGRQMLSAWC